MSEQEIEQQNTVSEDNRMILRTENLVKKYGKRTVVSHVSFDVKQGEIVGLLGPNGAGKTTSFYMTTGLIVPNEGHIFLNDLDITSYPVYKRAQNGIGYLAQEASVFRKMSVEDNIASVLELTNTTPEYQKDKLESLIAEFRLQKVRKNLGVRAQKLQKRAARFGCGPEDAAGAARALDSAKAGWDEAQTQESAGELLLAAADAMRLAGVDAEEALTFAAKRFTQRLEADETETGTRRIHRLLE